MGVKHFDVMNLGKTGLIDPEQLGYQDSVEIIKDESLKVQKSFVKIGWYLKHIRDNELYKEDGYNSIWECAADQLGYSQSTASRFISICEKFSKNHNSPELDAKYAGFDKSQMIEMLPMETEQLEKVTPDMTVKEIRDIKIKNKAPEPQEDKKTNDDIPGQTSIEKDFPEYLPDEQPLVQDEVETESYATSHRENDLCPPSASSCIIQGEADNVIDGEYREIRETEAVEETIATSQLSDSDKEELHDKNWFTRQYVKIFPGEASKLFEICRTEQNNSDRAKAIQKHIAPYGYHGNSCSEYDFTFHEFAAGMDFRIGGERMHLKYGAFVVELMKLLDEEGRQEERLSPYGLTKTVYPKGSLLTTAGCGHKYNCFSCAQDCEIRQKDRYCREAPMGNPFSCTTMNVLENLRTEMGDRCQFINLDTAYRTQGSNEPDPCCKDCDNGSCGYRCRRSINKVNTEIVDSGSALKDDLAATKYILEQEKKTLNDMLKFDDLPEMTVFKQKTIVAALAAMVCDLEAVESAPESEPQPELPILKNNDQRERRMDDITTELAAFVCDRLCKYLEILSEEELEEKCSACEMGNHICHILNEYNKVLKSEG